MTIVCSQAFVGESAVAVLQVYFYFRQTDIHKQTNRDTQNKNRQRNKHTHTNTSTFLLLLQTNRETQTDKQTFTNRHTQTYIHKQTNRLTHDCIASIFVQALEENVLIKSCRTINCATCRYHQIETIQLSLSERRGL